MAPNAPCSGRCLTCPLRKAFGALEAACDAYDHGRGVWPSSSASDRIEAMEKFISLIEPKRDQVAELLMWEIGKKRSDAEKEFDRTVVYLKDTIEEYKNLHREGRPHQSSFGSTRANSPRTLG